VQVEPFQVGREQYGSAQTLNSRIVRQARDAPAESRHRDESSAEGEGNEIGDVEREAAMRKVGEYDARR
jgi:hypothetical protein